MSLADAAALTKHLHRLFAVAAGLVLITAAGIPGLDAFAEAKVDDGFKRALAKNDLPAPWPAGWADPGGASAHSYLIRASLMG